MSPSDPTPTDQPQEISLAAAEAQYRQSMKAYSKLFERITPWLFDVGSWIFGGLIAVNLLIIGSLITVGPVDRFIELSAAAFALALPLNATGLVLLRLARDLRPVRFEEELVQTFQDVGLTPGEQQIPSLATLEALRKRGTQVVLSYAFGILALSVTFTLAGMVGALWHMAWWIAVAFFAMVLISLAIVLIAMVTSQPPISAAEKEQRRRSRDELIRQAKEQSRQAKEQR